MVHDNGQLTIPGWFITIVPWMVMLALGYAHLKEMERDQTQTRQGLCLISRALAKHDPTAHTGVDLICGDVTNGTNDVH